MKFQVLSDCHLEHDKDTGSQFIENYKAVGDCLIIAGDFITITEQFEDLFKSYIETLCDRFKYVVYVTGNHEYYGSDFHEVNFVVEELEKNIDNFHFLNNKSITLDGQKISGCTMWFEKSRASDTYEDYLGDFRWIIDFKKFVYEENTKSIQFLKDNLDSDIIVTHHMPSSQSTPPAYARSPINCYFVCNMLPYVSNFKGKWVHGHTHTPCRYSLGEGEVVCNPRGYPGENSVDYDMEYLV